MDLTHELALQYWATYKSDYKRELAKLTAIYEYASVSSVNRSIVDHMTGCIVGIVFLVVIGGPLSIYFLTFGLKYWLKLIISVAITVGVPVTLGLLFIEKDLKFVSYMRQSFEDNRIRDIFEHHRDIMDADKLSASSYDVADDYKVANPFDTGL